MENKKHLCEGCDDGGACGAGGCCGDGCGSCGPGWAGKRWHHHAVCGVLVGLVLLSLAAWLGFKARNEAREHKFIGVPIERNTITVSGEGKIVAIPDIAKIELGTTIERKSVADAQRENTRIMNELIDRLKGLGVDDEDIQTTGYTVYPAYDWNNGRQTLRGYTVSQTVSVKIRDLDKVGEIIGLAGGLGANQIGGIQFTVDDPEQLRQEARIKALENAKQKAEALAQVAGVKLRRVVSFSESVSGPIFPQPYYDRAFGLGEAKEGASAPSIEPGSNEIIMTVSITYEIE